MKAGKPPPMDTTGLSTSGLWVRRLRTAPSLADEAVCLAQVLHVWNLHETMEITSYEAVYAEVSGPDLQPIWVYLVELIGARTDGGFLFAGHPLSQVAVGEEVRILAIVQPRDLLIPGALVETRDRRRMVWLQVALAK